MSDDSFSPASYDVGRQDLENDLAESGAQFDPLEFPAGISPHLPLCATPGTAVDQCFYCNPPQTSLDPATPSPSIFQPSYHVRRHQQDHAPYGQVVQTPPPLSQYTQHFPAHVTPSMLDDALNDTYVQQSQPSCLQGPFVYGRMLQQSISSAPTTPSVTDSWDQGVWSAPTTIQESRMDVDQTQPSSGSCSNDGNEFQDHAKLLRGAPSRFQGPVEQGPVGVDPWMGESRVPGDRSLSAAATSHGLVLVINDEIPPPASQASTSSSASRRTRAQMLEKSDKNPYLCDSCGYTYPSNNELNKHIRHKHIGKERPYKCQHGDCGQPFVYPKDLRRHVRSKHLKNGWFLCQDETCQSVFPRKDNRDRHEREIHGLIRETCRSSSSQASGEADS